MEELNEDHAKCLIDVDDNQLAVEEYTQNVGLQTGGPKLDWKMQMKIKDQIHRVETAWLKNSWAKVSI